MQGDIRNFVEYLVCVRNAATNTVVSYERDLRKMSGYMAEQGICKSESVTATALNDYVLYLEKNGMSTATISRTIATLRRFFDFLCKQGRCKGDPSELLKAPRVERKNVRGVTKDELQQLKDVDAAGPKQLRDRAMVLSMSQGIRASEVIGLTIPDMNLEMGFLLLRGERRFRTVPIDGCLVDALRRYVSEGRDSLLKGKKNDALFVNCNGGGLSRQGVWKVVKYYGQRAGIQELTPDALRMPLG
ncbi:MAG: site-specific integrase [Lachnospiraceae bacterium]|nr:site-specific integrase [Lachnospiraceae bacterium]